MTNDKKIIASAVVFAVIILDQLSKNFASTYLTTSCNKGVAFGIGGNNAILITSVAGVIVFWMLTCEKRLLSSLGLALILAGGASNLIDRVSFGCVRDFITIGIWPSFNLADSAISVGVLMILASIFTKRQ